MAVSHCPSACGLPDDYRRSEAGCEWVRLVCLGWSARRRSPWEVNHGVAHRLEVAPILTGPDLRGEAGFRGGVTSLLAELGRTGSGPSQDSVPESPGLVSVRSLSDDFGLRFGGLPPPAPPPPHTHQRHTPVRSFRGSTRDSRCGACDLDQSEVGARAYGRTGACRRCLNAVRFLRRAPKRLEHACLVYSRAPQVAR